MLLKIQKPQKNYFLIIDLGSKYIKALLVNINLKSCLIREITESYIVESCGVIGCNIIEIEKVKQCIKEIISKAERKCEDNIVDVFLSFASSEIPTKVVAERIVVDEQKISKKNIDDLLFKVHNSFEDSIINLIPLNYSIDSMKGIKDPIGMYGQNIDANVHVIRVPEISLLNLRHVFSLNSLNICGCSISSYASCLSVSSDEDKVLGCIVVDIGHHFTSMGFFQEGFFKKSNAIPIGGKHITYDLAYALNTTIDNAEKIKKKYGGAFFTKDFNDSETIQIGDKNIDSKNIHVYSIIDYIKPRVEEIFEILFKELNVCNKIIITGGSAKLVGIKELISKIYEVEVEVGSVFYPVSKTNITMKSNKFASVAGMLQIILENIKINSDNKRKKNNYINKLISIFN